VAVHAYDVHQDQDAVVLIPIAILSSIASSTAPKTAENLPEYKGSPHAKTRRQACVVQVLEQLDGYNPTHHGDGLPSLVDLFPFPFPALDPFPDPYLCPSRVVASSRN